MQKTWSRYEAKTKISRQQEFCKSPRRSTRPWWPWTNVAWTWRWENAQGLSGRLQDYTMLPSGKRLHNYGKSPVSSWVNQWTKWPCSIATLVITRPGIPQFGLLGSGALSKVRAVGAPLNIGRLQLFPSWTIFFYRIHCMNHTPFFPT